MLKLVKLNFFLTFCRHLSFWWQSLLVLEKVSSEVRYYGHVQWLIIFRLSTEGLLYIVMCLQLRYRTTKDTKTSSLSYLRSYDINIEIENNKNDYNTEKYKSGFIIILNEKYL